MILKFRFSLVFEIEAACKVVKSYIFIKFCMESFGQSTFPFSFYIEHLPTIHVLESETKPYEIQTIPEILSLTNLELLLKIA